MINQKIQKAAKAIEALGLDLGELRVLVEVLKQLHDAQALASTPAGFKARGIKTP
jgi:hypothetical protein